MCHPAQSALRGEDFCCRNLHFNGSPKKLKQDSNPFFCGQQMSHHDLQSLKRPFSNLNRLANFNRGIDSDDFFRTHSRLKRDHNIFRQRRSGDPQSGRSLGFRENFQQRDVVPHRQISRTNNRETLPPRTRLALFESSCGNAIEARNTRCEIDAGPRSRPDAPASAAPLGRTKMAHRAAKARRMTWSQSQLRDCEPQVPKNSYNFFSPRRRPDVARSFPTPLPAANGAVLRDKRQYPGKAITAIRNLRMSLAPKAQPSSRRPAAPNQI